MKLSIRSIQHSHPFHRIFPLGGAMSVRWTPIPENSGFQKREKLSSATRQKDRVQGLVSLKPPRSKREAQSLFGKFNFLRASIKNFAPIGRHISQTYAGPRFKWTDEAQQALETLKKLVSESTMTRAIPDPIRESSEN